MNKGLLYRILEPELIRLERLERLIPSPPLSLDKRAEGLQKSKGVAKGWKYSQGYFKSQILVTEPTGPSQSLDGTFLGHQSILEALGAAGREGRGYSRHTGLTASSGQRGICP